MGRITDLYVQNQRYSRPNLDISHRCLLRCPQCIRQKLTSKDQIKRSFDINTEDFAKIKDYYNNGITFCGQISDPIYHPNFLDFLRMCDGEGRALRIATNGSGKSREWWNEAFSYGKGENAWYFGVDGIDEKSELYRVGSNFEEVWDRMKYGRSLGHTIVWQYIIFDYNEHEVDRAVEIAKEEDFSLLLIKTNRGFGTKNKPFRKNVEFKVGEPGYKNLSKKIKGETWAYKSKTLEEWQRIRRRAL